MSASATTGARQDFRTLVLGTPRINLVLGTALALALAGLGAAHHMDVNGHWVTGMNNHVVWGVPHVFAVFLIVVASGALNVASMSSVFKLDFYAPLARVAAIIAITSLAGGLAVLVLDLGRPDRLIVAMTHYNFTSVFTWNVFLYTGFVGLVAVYLWTLMDRSVRGWSKRLGVAALAWRFVLTSGTGFIFGFLVARDGYDAALLAPLFVMLSLSGGLAWFLLVGMPLTARAGWRMGEADCARIARLLAILVLASLYLSLVMHVGALYVREHAGFESFILRTGGGYTTLYWIGYVLFGSLVPALLLLTPMGRTTGLVFGAATLVVLGTWMNLYVLIIAGQAYPMDLVSGYDVIASSFADGVVAPYAPSWPEIILGLGGIGVAIAGVLIVSRVLPLLPVAVDAEEPASRADAV